MGEAAALIAAFMWSATSVAMAALGARITPVAMSALRLSVATLVLPLVLALSGQWHEVLDADREQVAALVGSGLLAYAIGDTMYIASLGKLGVQRAFTLTMTLFIALTVAGGVVLLDEELRWLQGAGAVLIAGGVIVLVRSRRAASEEARSADVRGYVLVVAVGVFWAAATLWLAGGRGDMGSISASALRTPASAGAMLGFALITAPRDLISPFRRRREWMSVVAIGLLSTLFGSLLYVYAVGEAGASTTTILNATSPLLALPLAVLVLKEPFTRKAGLGTVICVAGIVCVVAPWG
ncbi:MAG: DMT family transporter [Dehalococcoidia bacterium]